MPTFLIDVKVETSLALNIYADSKDEALKLATNAMETLPYVEMTMMPVPNVHILDAIATDAIVLDD